MFEPVSQPHRRARSRPALFTTMLAAVALAACDDSPTAPVAPEPVNQAPAVTSIAMADDGYRKARLTGAVADPENAIASVQIDWGDGSTSAVTGDLGAISVQHTYDRAQDYTVTLTVTDAEGLTAQRASSIRIDVPDPFCLDLFKVVGFCVGGSSNLRNFDLEVRVLNQVVYSSEIREGSGELDVPLGAGVGNLKFVFDMDAGRITVSGEVCPIPFLVCETVVTRTIQLNT